MHSPEDAPRAAGATAVPPAGNQVKLLVAPSGEVAASVLWGIGAWGGRCPSLTDRAAVTAAHGRGDRAGGYQRTGRAPEPFAASVRIGTAYMPGSRSTSDEVEAHAIVSMCRDLLPE